MGFRLYGKLTWIKKEKRLFAYLIRPFYEEYIFNFGRPLRASLE